MALPALLLPSTVPGFRHTPVPSMFRRLALKLHQYPDGVAPAPATEADEQSRSVIAKVAADRPEVHLIDLRAPLCGASGCRFAMGDQALYVDWDHLSPLGAQIALAGLRLR